MKNIKKEKLGNIALINFGLHKKGEQVGKVKYLHTRHFDENYQPKRFSLSESFINVTEKEERFLLKPNDVILTGKGSRLFAWAYEPDFGLAMPSSVFYTIQVNSTLINHHYLAYYLNSEKMQHQLQTIGAGATITSIPKKELQEVRIAIPALAQQLKIVEVLKTMEKDLDLTTQILKQKKELKKGVLNKMIHNAVNL